MENGKICLQRSCLSCRVRQTESSQTIYGDKRSSDNGKNALLHVSADGDIFDLVENASYRRSKADTKAHKKTDYFDYFIKTVQIDGKVYDLLADVKKQYGKDGGYVYTLVLRNNKKFKALPAKGTTNGPLKVAGKALASSQNVSQPSKIVKNKFSLKTVNGKQIVWIDNGNLTSKQLNSHTAIANYIAQHIGEVYTIIESGQKVYLGEDLPSEYTQSKYTSLLRSTNQQTLRAKNKAADGLGELIETASNRRWEKTKHNQNKDAKYGMYRYDSSFAFPVKDANGKVTNVRAYNVELLIRNASDGKKYLYDIVGIRRNATAEIDLLQRETRHGGHVAASQRGVSVDDSISHNADLVKNKFSLKSPVEETGTLVALHNLTADKLSKAFKLGGFPMPPIAVTRTDIPHTNFGDITLVMNRSTVDPKANRKNMVYSADAWTPTFPRIEYEVNREAENRIYKKINGLSSKVDDFFRDDLSRLTGDLDDALNRHDGEAGLIQYAMNNYGLKAAYLEEQGQHIGKITKQQEAEKGYSLERADKYRAILDVLDVTDADEIGSIPLKDIRERCGLVFSTDSVIIRA